MGLGLAQEDGSGSGEEASAEGEEEEAPAEEGGEEAHAEEGGEEAPAEEGEEAPAEEGGEEGAEEDCEVEETDGEGSGDDIGDLLAIGGASKKCKSKSGEEEGDEEASGEEASGADALAAAVGGETCDKEGMDPKVTNGISIPYWIHITLFAVQVAECLGGLETQVGDLMTAIMGPEGGGGTLEDKIALVLVKKGVISCENETQCDDNKQCLKQPDGMSRCENPCERADIIRWKRNTIVIGGKYNYPRCDVPFSECITEEHLPGCFCKENFKGNGTDVCIPDGFTEEANKVSLAFLQAEELNLTVF